jgi:hypothetical protein
MPWLATLVLAVDAGLTVLAWMVHTIIYPAFPAISPLRFRDWHRDYSRRIGRIVLPLMLAQVALHGLWAWQARDVWSLAAAALVVATWLVTFLGAVPCHRSFGGHGFGAPVHARLMRWNLVRTVLWTAIAALALVQVLR